MLCVHRRSSHATGSGTDYQGEDHMSDFFIPCGLLLGTVFVSFLLMCWFFHATYIKNLQARVRYLEYLVIPPKRTTEDFVVRENTLRPTRPSRYVSVERSPRYQETEEEY